MNANQPGGAPLTAAHPAEFAVRRRSVLVACGPRSTRDVDFSLLRFGDVDLTRRFFARHRAVSLKATGFASPYPVAIVILCLICRHDDLPLASSRESRGPW